MAHSPKQSDKAPKPQLSQWAREGLAEPNAESSNTNTLCDLGVGPGARGSPCGGLCAVACGVSMGCAHCVHKQRNANLEMSMRRAARK